MSLSIPVILKHEQATPPSSQLVAIGIMLSIPSLQLRIRHSDQLVRNCAVLLIHSSLLANRITFSLRNEVDPEVVVNATGSDAGKKS